VYAIGSGGLVLGRQARRGKGSILLSGTLRRAWNKFANLNDPSGKPGRDLRGLNQILFRVTIDRRRFGTSLVDLPSIPIGPQMTASGWTMSSHVTPRTTTSVRVRPPDSTCIRQNPPQQRTGRG
jgi:hypothetical protein